MLSPVAVAVALSAYLLVAIVVLAALRPGYSHRRDTISQLSERGAPRAKLAGLGVFLPVGLGLWELARLCWPQSHPVSWLALSLGVGYVIGGLFPCDYGLPHHGSPRQKVHNFGGLVEYLGSAFALYQLAPQQAALSPVFYASALFAPLAAATAFIRPLEPVRGSVQRIAESLLFGCLIVAVWRVQR